MKNTEWGKRDKQNITLEKKAKTTRRRSEEKKKKIIKMKIRNKKNRMIRIELIYK